MSVLRYAPSRSPHSPSGLHKQTVVPAKAGTHFLKAWAPAFAGATWGLFHPRAGLAHDPRPFRHLGAHVIGGLRERRRGGVEGERIEPRAHVRARHRLEQRIV